MRSGNFIFSYSYEMKLSNFLKQLLTVVFILKKTHQKNQKTSNSRICSFVKYFQANETALGFEYLWTVEQSNSAADWFVFSQFLDNNRAQWHRGIICVKL